MNRVRFGIAGTGTVVRTCHLPVLAANPRADVAAICNLRAESLERLAAQYNIPKTYSSFAAMAADRAIDAVLIALPNYLHASVAIAMLESGKHVLCEKPMALTAAEARGMCLAADAAGRKLMIAHVWRCSPEVRWLRAIVDEGKLGTISKVVAHAVVVGRGPELGSWFHRPEMAGGGALADVGIHGIDTISFLFHDRIDPVRVTATTENHYRPLAVEDTACVQIEYDNGLLADLAAGWYHDHCASSHGAVEVFGSAGCGRTLPARWRLHGAEAWTDFVPEAASGHPDADQSLYASQIDHFLDCILEDRRPVCDGVQGLRDMIVLESAYRAAREGTPVVLDRPIVPVRAAAGF